MLLPLQFQCYRLSKLVAFCPWQAGNHADPAAKLSAAPTIRTAAPAIRAATWANAISTAAAVRAATSVLPAASAAHDAKSGFDGCLQRCTNWTDRADRMTELAQQIATSGAIRTRLRSSWPRSSRMWRRCSPTSAALM